MEYQVHLYIVESSKLEPPSILKHLKLEKIGYRVQHSRKNSPMAAPQLLGAAKSLNWNGSRFFFKIKHQYFSHFCCLCISSFSPFSDFFGGNAVFGGRESWKLNRKPIFFVFFFFRPPCDPHLGPENRKMLSLSQKTEKWWLVAIIICHELITRQNKQ